MDNEIIELVRKWVDFHGTQQKAAESIIDLNSGKHYSNTTVSKWMSGTLKPGGYIIRQIKDQMEDNINHNEKLNINNKKIIDTDKTTGVESCPIIT